MRRAAVAPALAVVLAACAALRSPALAQSSRGTAEPERGCPPERAPDGEVRLVFLGDSGYGTGTSQWGTPGQEAIADRIDNLHLLPDLVFFLGDNVYWTGSSSLYKDRFDDMYEPLIRDCRVHVALGNHDVKGCLPAADGEGALTCLDKLKAGLAADRVARYLREGMEEPAARATAEKETAAEVEGPAGAAALAALRASCFAGDASAYRDLRPGSCNAAPALKHAQFGFGSGAEDAPEERQRYYSVSWPVSPPTGEGVSPGQVSPLVQVAVLDSNTLRVRGGLLQDADGRHRREDRLQLLWLRSTLATARVRPGTSAGGPWRLLVMHHPLVSPRACACRLFGHCLGGHDEDTGFQQQLREALQGVDGPELVIAAHNHLYARSRPLDRSGAPVLEGSGGVRHFVTGGGGAPLYAVASADRRFARALTMYHFLYLRLTASAGFFWAVDAAGQVRDSGCFERGSNLDEPLAKGLHYDDPLPPRCGS